MAQQQDTDRVKEKRFDDHSVIVPPHSLKKAVTHAVGPTPVDMAVVERAEAALAELKDEFIVWMNAECERVDAARRLVRERGLTRATADQLFAPAHDIKGGASTLGYPLAERIATSLCRLLRHAPDPARIPFALIDHHVDAIRAVVREEVKDPLNPYGLEISGQLAVMVETFLAAELKDNYAEIAGDAAPRIEIKSKY